MTSQFSLRNELFRLSSKFFLWNYLMDHVRSYFCEYFDSSLSTVTICDVLGFQIDAESDKNLIHSHPDRFDFIRSCRVIKTTAETFRQIRVPHQFD